MDIPDIPLKDKTADEEKAAASRLRALYDSYGLVFIGILLTLLILATLGDRPYGRALGVFLLGGIFMLTLAASAVKRSLLRVALAIVAPVVIAAIIASAVSSTAISEWTNLIVALLLVIASPAVIAKRIITRSEVSTRTVIGALCIYLFVGLFFALLYSVFDLLTDTDLLAQLSDPRVIDYIYFSFTTITTLGYGDLTPADNVVKMGAIIEAIIGQLYLVTVVAVVIGRLGARAREN